MKTVIDLPETTKFNKLKWCYYDRIIAEFEAIQKQALTKPEDTKEMMDMLKFIENAKAKSLVQLDKDIKVL